MLNEAVSPAATEPGVDEQAHRALIYGVDAQLIETGGGLLADVLAEGGAAIVIANRAHLRALEEWVRLCGPDVEGAAAERRYHALAVETMLTWLEQDAHPAARFELRLQEVLAQIPREFAPVLIFGELAAALWERGRLGAAFGLEHVCQSLRADRPVSVVCAYPERVLSSATYVEHACRGHTAVLAAPAFPRSPPDGSSAVLASTVLPPIPAACRTARLLVRDAFARDGAAATRDAAEMVIGELAANAVRHACSTFTAEVSLSDGALRLAVTDSAPLPAGWSGFPIRRDHGLGVVAALSDSWDVQPLRGGKLVWADVPRGQA